MVVTKLCERWCVTKWCVKDGVTFAVRERRRLTKLRVKDGVWQSGV